MDRLGPGTIEAHRSPEETERAFNEVMSIEKRSWKWVKRIAVNSMAFGGFCRKLTERVSLMGELCIRILRLNGRSILFGLFLEHMATCHP